MTAQPDRPLFGILLMLGFCILAPLSDSVAKILGSVMPLGMLLLARFALQPLVLLPISAATGGLRRYPPRILRLILWRTLLHIGGIGCMFAALRYMPLADAIAIAFVMPFLMLLLGWLFLNEVVGLFRLAACAVGFLGTLLVIQPNFAEVGLPALLPLLVAVFFALFMLVTRQIAREIDAVTVQAISGLMATALLLPAVLLVPAFGPFALPQGSTALLLLLLGTLGTLAHLLMTWSLRYAPAATVAPMQYLEIPVATLVGWAIFRDLPDGLAAIGIALTLGAGLAIILRERAIARHPAQPAP